MLMPLLDMYSNYSIPVGTLHTAITHVIKYWNCRLSCAYIATGIHLRLCSSNTAFNHVSDCSVQCMNRTINPQPTVTRAVTPTTMTENATVKITMMRLPLQCKTETN